ncbi:MAG: ABC transporter substrate-binding protein [Desulfomonilia bacterium]
MKNIIVFFVKLIAFSLLSAPCFAEEKVYKIEVLQVAKIDAFQISYNAFLDTLKNEGFVQGKNLKVNRVIIDYNVEGGGFLDKMGVLFKIKSEASRIASAKPDLAVTIGTPATKYARDKITSAGIPLVFISVAIPQAPGCPSLTNGGPGVTGATLYFDMKSALKIVKAAVPNIKTIGMVSSEDENGIAHVQDAKKNAPGFGMTVISKQVSKKDSIKPAIKALKDQGAEAYAIPLDTYYGIKNYQNVNDLDEFCRANKIPIISFVFQHTKGAVLSVGTDFDTVGELGGQNALKILKEGKKPETLPILKQEDLKIMVDTERMKALDIQIPMEILQIAKPAK